MAYIENRTFDEIKVGETASLRHTLVTKDIELFAAVSCDAISCDLNANVDIKVAKEDMTHTTIAHGIWSLSLISTVIGTKLPGPGVVYLEQNLKFLHPVTIGDKVIVSVTVTKKESKNHSLKLECKCINQHHKTIIEGVISVIAPTTKIKRKQVEPPRIIITESKGAWYNHFISLKDSFAPLKTAVVHPVDALALQGVVDAAKENLIMPILIGPKEQILAAAKEADLDIASYQIISTEYGSESAEVAVDLARDGKVEAIMKGLIHTDDLMKPIVDKEKGLRTEQRISHVFLIEAPNYSKPLFLTDAAINIRPNLQEKKDIVQNAINLFRGLNLGTPKVAIVSATEMVNEKIPSTLDATALCKMAERGQITGGILDGPLAFDNAISFESAREKNIHSAVAGNADIIVVPDIESGNMLYKQMTYLSGMEAAGIVMGAKVPIILTSRGSDAISRKASCAMALVYMRNKERING